MRIAAVLPGFLVLALTGAGPADPLANALGREDEPVRVPPHASPRMTVAHGVGPELQSIASLAFGPKDVLYVADPRAATIYALELGKPAPNTARGTKSITDLGSALAATLGTDTSQVVVTGGFVVHPVTKNSYLTVLRGRGAEAKPVLVRIDGEGKLNIVDLAPIKFSSVTLPNQVQTNSTIRGNARNFTITHMDFTDGQLFVSGLSSEEFAATLWRISYPFKAADRGTGIRIFHANHYQMETAAPIFTFVPYTLGKTPSIVAGYLCTPIVTIPVASLTPGAKIDGKTVTDLGGNNRPSDMLAYTKNGQEYLLVANSNQRTMKLSLATIAAAPALSTANNDARLAAPVINELSGILRMEKLGTDSMVVLRGTPTGGILVTTVPLP